MVIPRLDGKVTPEVLQTIYMDEIAGRLGQLTELLERETPSGDLVSGVVAVTDTPIEVNLGEWIKVSFYVNTGGDNVWVYNTRQPADTNDAYLAAGDSLPIDNKVRTTKRFYLVCASGGTATVRWFKV